MKKRTNMEKLIDVPFIARRKMEQFTAADLNIQIRQKPTILPKVALILIQTTAKFSSQFRMTSCIMGYCSTTQQLWGNIDIRPEHQAYA